MNFSQPSILLLGGFLKEEEFTKFCEANFKDRGNITYSPLNPLRDVYIGNVFIRRRNRKKNLERLLGSYDYVITVDSCYWGDIADVARRKNLPYIAFIYKNNEFIKKLEVNSNIRSSVLIAQTDFDDNKNTCKEIEEKQFDRCLLLCRELINFLSGCESSSFSFERVRDCLINKKACFLGMAQAIGENRAKNAMREAVKISQCPHKADASFAFVSGKNITVREKDSIRHHLIHLRKNQTVPLEVFCTEDPTLGSAINIFFLGIFC